MTISWTKAGPLMNTSIHRLHVVAFMLILRIYWLDKFRSAAGSGWYHSENLTSKTSFSLITRRRDWMLHIVSACLHTYVLAQIETTSRPIRNIENEHKILYRFVQHNSMYTGTQLCFSTRWSQSEPLILAHFPGLTSSQGIILLWTSQVKLGFWCLISIFLSELA